MDIRMRVRRYVWFSALFCGCLLAFANTSVISTAQATEANEWTWMGGSNTIGSSCSQVVFCGQPGVYGTLGTPSPGNIPGSRFSASNWTDSAGNLWLFGGAGFDSSGQDFFLNDLWKFSPSTNEWTWVGGSNTINQSGVYGMLGEPAARNIPGARSSAASWTDSSGNFWLFGGWGMDGSGSYSALNDLWEFNPSTGEWVWMSGSNTINQASVNGTLGIPSAQNVPGALYEGVGWTDSGHLWLLGGLGYDGSGILGYPDDLWEFNPSTSEWTWIGGGSTLGSICINGMFCGQVGVYGTLGIPAAGNLPGSRNGALNWTDNSGNLWLFFGQGYYSNGSNADLNDVWEFNPAKNEWAWMGGSSSCPASSFCESPGIYGTLGSAAPGNLPGSRDSSSPWGDSSGHLWLFGGEGEDAYGSPGLLNDLWEFNPSANEWAWMGGSNTVGTHVASGHVGQSGVYGSLGAPATGNVPGGRGSASTWIDRSGHFWLFGGAGFDASGNWGYLNDLWEYQPSSTAFPPPDFTVTASPGTLTVTAGSSGVTTVSVAASNGFNAAVTFSCSGLPSGASCSFSPANVTPSGAAASTTTLTVATLSSTAALRGNSPPLFPTTALATAICCIGWKKQRRLAVLLLLAIGVAASGLNGCGGGGSQRSVQPLTSTITVTAVSGAI
jgi:N-acetylneuraminic acid mutarotase